MSDYNKPLRDNERYILHKAGWKAGNGLKKTGAFKWIWIHPTRTKAYSRKEAVAIARRELAKS